VHSEGGQATVEWVALVLAAALVLGAAAAFAGREADPGVGEAVAKRITSAVRGVGRVPGRGEAATGAPAPGSATTGMGAPSAAAPGGAAPPPTEAAPSPAMPRPSPLSSLTRAVGLAGSVAGIGRVAKHGWIVCLGYERWKHEREDPVEPTDTLPVDAALSIVNTCFNPHDYLLED
jgi:hypothetical protein